MQEEENISIATKTTSQCHVTLVEAAATQKTDSCTRTEQPAPPSSLLGVGQLMTMKCVSIKLETNWP